MLTVSLVIPIKNAIRTLPACLAALDRLNPAPTEVLLVDNESTDASAVFLQAWAEQTRHFTVQLLREVKPGAAAARNAGIRVATSEIVAFTDSDCAPQSDWLALSLGAICRCHNRRCRRSHRRSLQSNGMRIVLFALYVAIVSRIDYASRVDPLVRWVSDRQSCRASPSLGTTRRVRRERQDLRRGL